MFQVELVWNREFNFLLYGPPHLDLDSAVEYAQALVNSGDGERVKKSRVVDGNGNVVWANGNMVAQKVEEVNEDQSKEAQPEMPAVPVICETAS